MMETGVPSATLSKRALRSLECPNMIGVMYQKFLANMYNEESNPKGIVSMGIAENHLCAPLCCERLNMPDMNVVTNDMLQYFDFRGKPGLRGAICKFMTKYFEPAEPLDPDDVYVTCGAASALDLSAWLFAESGDYILVLAPHYAAFNCDFNCRWNVKLIPVNIDVAMFNKEITSTDIERIIGQLEDTFAQVTEEGKNIMGLLVTNPHNPSGVIMPLEFTEAILAFTNRHDIHALLDEVYALTIIDNDAKFDSVLKIKNIPNKKKTHLIWGLSKDFGIAGVRCGVLYTRNKELQSVVTDFLSFGCLSPLLQHKVQVFLSDFNWLDGFLVRNKAMMKESCDYCIDQLEELNIPYIRPKAGYFLWTDMSKFLTKKTYAAELEFVHKLLEGGLFVLPGQCQAAEEPGWIRFTFTHPVSYLTKGFMNLRHVLEQQ